MKKQADFMDMMAKLEEKNKRIKELNEEIKVLEEEKEFIVSFLTQEIPIGEVKNGVQHLVTERKNVSYSKVLDEVVERYVPKTKHSLVEGLVKDFTTYSTSHRFKVVQD